MASLLSKEAMNELANDLLDVLLEKLDERLLAQDKRPLMQKEVMKEYGATAKDIQEWRVAGLKYIKNGKRNMYDRKDIEEIRDKLKK